MAHNPAASTGVISITGGASGIGLTLAAGLLERGWRVLILDIMQDRLDAAAAELQAYDATQWQCRQADVTSEAAINALMDQAEQDFGPLHGLINSAGIAAEVPFLDTDSETFRRILDVNVIGSFICARAAARHMATRTRGAIINIASVSGMRGNYGRIAYGASKAAIINMTQVMAVELAHYGIRVNAVAPGPIDTPLTRKIHSATTRESWNRTVAMARYGEPHELCGTVQWLLDDSASGYVTGQTVAVDGGFTAMGLPPPPTNEPSGLHS